MRELRVRTSGLAWTLAIPLLHLVGCAASTEEELTLGEDEYTIKNAHAVSPSNLLGMVKVTRPIAGGKTAACSGMVISETAVLTAAHCVCTENYAGGNVCVKNASITFRPAPGSGSSPPAVKGTVTFHPDYDPSVLDTQINHDLAIIRIPFGSRPPHAQPFVVSTAYAPTGTPLMLAGFGLTGQSCGGTFGTLNYDEAVLGAHEPNGTVSMQSDEWCQGDSGGAVLLADGSLSPTKLVGVISATVPVTGTSLATATWSHFGWIQANTPDLNATLVPRFSEEEQVYPSLDFGVPSTWEPITGDFDGDGRTDYARIGASGAWVFLARSGSGFSTGFSAYTDLWFDQPSPWQTVTGDFNGDGRTDYGRLGAGGAWIFSAQPGGGFRQDFQVYESGWNFGLPSTWEAITGDFNGDGIQDYARLGSTMARFFLGRAGGGFVQRSQPYTGLSFGQPSSWQTITGDFNGDRRTDHARLGPTGAWVFTMQSNGTFTQGFQTYGSGLNFGFPSTWEPITGDFNGDGKGDYARVGSTGAWVYLSTGNGFTEGFQTYNGLDFGQPSPWKTITGDFNGDGKGDYARLGNTGAWVFSGASTPFESVFQTYDGSAAVFGLPSQWQTITGKFNGGTKTGYARLGATNAWVFRGQ